LNRISWTDIVCLSYFAFFFFFWMHLFFFFSWTILELLSSLFSHQPIKLPRLNVSKTEVPTFDLNPPSYTERVTKHLHASTFYGTLITTGFLNSTPCWFHSKSKENEHKQPWGREDSSSKL
jgi:hypothetical protein